MFSMCGLCVSFMPAFTPNRYKDVQLLIIATAFRKDSMMSRRSIEVTAISMNSESVYLVF